MDHIASLDFETGSRTDLRKTGAAKYSECPTTRVLCASCYVPGTDGGFMRWNYLERPPEALERWVRDGHVLSAWNATFEYYIWNNVLRRKWPSLPTLSHRQLLDTMAVAATNGLPLGLDMCAKALPRLGVQKDKQGHALMMRMSRPRSLGATPNEDTWWHLDEPDRLARLMDYCDQDVKVERAILGTLDMMSRNERDVWEMDFEVGDRGMAFDYALADKMEVIADRETKRLDCDMRTLTGGEVSTTRSVGALLKYAQRVLPSIKSLPKDRLNFYIDWIEDNAAYGDTHLWNLQEVLKVRREAAKSSVAKLTAMRNYACRDGRMRFLTQYYGAFRTGRWAGRGPQLQNYPRSEVKDQEALIRALKMGMDEEGLGLFFGVTPLAALSSALRGCICAPAKAAFGAIDFSQIEARVLPWLAGDAEKLQLFRDGKDLYVVAAQGIYGAGPIDDMKRSVGKVSELALGFGGGVGAFQNMAKVYGLDITDEEADVFKHKWRAANADIVQFWWDLDKAALRAMDNPGASVPVGPVWESKLTFEFNPLDGHLRMFLPSGRALVYRDAKIGTGKFGGLCVTYMGQDQYTNQWKRLETYGGKWAENATQAVARDIMASAMLRVHHSSPADLIGSVHDEALMELDAIRAHVDFKHTQTEFEFVPLWAQNLPIAADGYVSDRFKKG